MSCRSRKTTFPPSAAQVKPGHLQSVNLGAERTRRSTNTSSTSTGGSTTVRELEERLNIEFQRHKPDWSERAGSTSYSQLLLLLLPLWARRGGLRSINREKNREKGPLALMLISAGLEQISRHLSPCLDNSSLPLRRLTNTPSS